MVRLRYSKLKGFKNNPASRSKAPNFKRNVNVWQPSQYSAQVRFIFGIVLASSLLTAVMVGQLDAFTGQIIAGIEGSYGSSGEGQVATEALLYKPSGVFVNIFSDIYIADQENHAIRKVEHGDGTIKTHAGQLETPGKTGDGGPATSATLKRPRDIIVDDNGNIYISDYLNHSVRMVDSHARYITTVAGTIGQSGFTGDGGLATASKLDRPLGLSFDPDGNILVADQHNHRIRRVNRSTGLIDTVAGSVGQGSSGDGGPATDAQLSLPSGVTADSQGNIYIADLGNHVVRMVNHANGSIDTIAGIIGSPGYTGDEGPATSAQLRYPTSIALDYWGNLYIADSLNDAVRRVDARSGIISTVVGLDVTDGLPDQAKIDLGQPVDVFIDRLGTLYIADISSHVVWKIPGLAEEDPYFLRPVVATPRDTPTPTPPLTVVPVAEVTPVAAADVDGLVIFQPDGRSTINIADTASLSIEAASRQATFQLDTDTSLSHCASLNEPNKTVIRCLSFTSWDYSGVRLDDSTLWRNSTLTVKLQQDDIDLFGGISPMYSEYLKGNITFLQPPTADTGGDWQPIHTTFDGPRKQVSTGYLSNLAVVALTWQPDIDSTASHSTSHDEVHGVIANTSNSASSEIFSSPTPTFTATQLPIAESVQSTEGEQSLPSVGPAPIWRFASFAIALIGLSLIMTSGLYLIQKARKTNT